MRRGEPAVQAVADPRPEPVSLGEHVEVVVEVTHRRQEDQAFDLGAVRQGQRGGLGAQGVRDDGAGRGRGRG